VTTPPPERERDRAGTALRARAGWAGAFDCSSACSSRLQIGQFAVRRL
jgi:hypothetical protein